MVDSETIESYLIQMDVSAEQIGEGLWRVDDPSDEVPALIVSFEPPIVYVRLKVMDVPETGRAALFEKLLTLNASGIAYGAYALENEEILLIDTLPAATVDLEELQASVDSLILAATEHYRELNALVRGGN